MVEEEKVCSIGPSSSLLIATVASMVLLASTQLQEHGAKVKVVPELDVELEDFEAGQLLQD